MSRLLYRLGRLAARHPWRTIGVWLLAAVAIVAASGAFGSELEDTFEVPGLDSQIAAELLENAGSDSAGLTAQLVVTPEASGATFFDGAGAADALLDVHEAASELPNVVAVADVAGALAAGADVATQTGLVSPDGRVAVLQLQYPVIEDVSTADLEALKELRAELDGRDDVRVEARGDIFFSFEEPETGTGELIGLVAAVVILVVAFGSLIAMGLPIAMALFGLAIGVSAMALINLLIEVPSWAPQSASMVGIGVGIDYALFVVTRHREHLARGMTVEESAGRAVATAGQAVIFAGGTVVIAILGMAVTGIPFMTAAGVAISAIVAIMVIASVTLLPGLLGLAGHHIDRISLRPRPSAGRQRAASPGWYRWGNHVARHAWTYAIGVTVLLLTLTAPVLDLRLGFPDDGSLADHRTERQAYDLIADGFGPGTTGPLVVAVALNSDPTVVQPLADAIAADPGIADVAPGEIDAKMDVATIIAFPTTSPQDEATLDTVKRLRSDVFPEILTDSTATAHVGGQTATIGDVGDRVNDRMFAFIGAVILLSFVLLVLVFRSILVPLKAAFLNLMSIGAAYGVLVMVFQWGWGKGLIGLETTVPIVPFIPMFMFAVLFGLSMDYEVFLLSRVREDYLATRDNDHSVVTGIASTARVITSAALIMISVFLGFVLGDEPVIKMLGLGLATAIFVDATIVRMVLVPATMKLMGDANWWMPAWLDRLLPTIDIEGEHGLPEPEYEPVTADLVESTDEERELVRA